jgi:hypothetical protein
MFALEDVRIAMKALRDMYAVNVAVFLTSSEHTASKLLWHVSWSPAAIWWNYPDTPADRLTMGYYEEPVSPRDTLSPSSIFRLLMRAETDIERWYQKAVALTGVSPGDS